MFGDGARRTARVGESAVVVGASIAGLCAARVLSERFERVTVIDRDTLPAGLDTRGQVPQGRHPHLLLTAGARLLEQWFPCVIAELVAAGAVEIDLCRDFRWHQGGGYQRRPESALRSPSMSRPLLENTVRRRVAALSNVKILDGAAVVGLTTDASGAQITGVRLEAGEILASELLVDASGRQARSLAWLSDLGFQAPTTSVVQVDTKYVSKVYRRGDDSFVDWKAAAVIDEPASKRLAMVLPIEDNRWILTLVGINGASAPAEPDAMLDYARSFPSQDIAHVMATCEPLTDAVVHRFVANNRRRVERLRRFPLGWVMLGDAVCSFDPIYGQGLTAAAQQAAELGRQLDRHCAVDHSFARAYFKAAAQIVNVPWSIAVGGDFVYEGTTGKKPFGTDRVNRYMDRVIQAGQHDDDVVIRFNETMCLLRNPQSLMAPAFVLRVLRASRRPAPQPRRVTGAVTMRSPTR